MMLSGRFCSIPQPTNRTGANVPRLRGSELGEHGLRQAGKAAGDSCREARAETYVRNLHGEHDKPLWRAAHGLGKLDRVRNAKPMGARRSNRRPGAGGRRAVGGTVGIWPSREDHAAVNPARDRRRTAHRVDDDREPDP